MDGIKLEITQGEGSMTTKKRADSGFTLIEILVALALSGIVLTAIYTAYQSQHKTYIAQESVAKMQQNLRAAMYLMTQEIRMAGYDPRGTANAGIETADPDELKFTKDLDGDGTIDSGNSEDITYSLYTTDGIQKLGRKNPTQNKAVALNIDALNFIYLDEDDQDINDVGGTVSDIRSVQITIVARTGRSDPDYNNTFTYPNLQGDWEFDPPNDGYHRRSLSSQVKCRNLGL